tara:strand:+ start:2879 stop:3637 length:759 start_codon:yes stop_codon:yes gene_type:complete
MRILVLGCRGMLGRSAVHHYRRLGHCVLTDMYRWPHKKLKDFIRLFDGDLIINCVASTSKGSDFQVNYELPLFIAEHMRDGVKYIHPDTDAVYRGDIPSGELYDKKTPSDAIDEYGISKSLSSEIVSPNVKFIRSSIVGMDVKKRHLLSWFLSQKSVRGYTNHYWNGITTYHWSLLSNKIFNDWGNYDFVTQAGSECISKYELLKIFRSVFSVNIEIIPHRHKVDINRCLKLDINMGGIREQLQALKKASEP